MVYLPLNWIGQALDVAIKAFNVQKDNIDTQIVKLQWAYNTLLAPNTKLYCHIGISYLSTRQIKGNIFEILMFCLVLK